MFIVADDDSPRISRGLSDAFKALGVTNNRFCSIPYRDGPRILPETLVALNIANQMTIANQPRIAVYLDLAPHYEGNRPDTKYGLQILKELTRALHFTDPRDLLRRTDVAIVIYSGYQASPQHFMDVLGFYPTDISYVLGGELGIAQLNTRSLPLLIRQNKLDDEKTLVDTLLAWF